MPLVLSHGLTIGIAARNDARVYELRMPAPDLAPFIDNYWFVGAAAPEPFALRVDVFVDGRADLIFNFGAPYTREVIGGARRKISRSNLDAQRLMPIRIQQQGVLRTMGVRFRLGGLGAFAQSSLQAFTGQTPTVQAVLGPDAIALETALSNTHDADVHARIFDDFFRAHRVASEGFESFERSLKLAIDKRGAARLDELAAVANASIRHVERLFARYLGFSPRALNRVLRFQHALGALMHDQKCLLADVAAAAGYFDQAHFIRDFKAMTGGVPRGYRGYFPPEGPEDFAPNVVVFVQDRVRNAGYSHRRAKGS